jgi:flagellar hook-associated protein 3 FlgL
MVMRVTTINQCATSINAIAKQYEQIERLQTQVATGKKIQHASEDPLLYLRMKEMDDTVNNLKSYQFNGVLADNRTNLFDSSTQQNINNLQRVHELIIQAQSDTLNNDARESISKELDTMLTSMVNIANTQDSDGNYIFSGMNLHTPAFQVQSGQYVYTGSQSSTAIPIATNLSVTYNEVGSQIFGVNGTDNVFNVVKNLINILKQPVSTEADLAAMHVSVATQASYVTDALGNLNNYIAVVGARSNNINNYLTMSQNNLIDNQIMAGKISDADLGQVISQLSQRLTTLEVTQQSYLNIQETYYKLLNIT